MKKHKEFCPINSLLKGDWSAEIEAVRQEERERVLGIIERMKKRINKNTTTVEQRRYPTGYNLALNDLKEKI